MHVNHEKHHCIFRHDSSIQISHCPHVIPRLYSYLASECSVCLQPYSVAHSSSKEWYVATKESLHWCHNNGRPWRCNNRSWMSWGLKADLIRNHSRATLQIAGARQFPATPTQQSYWDKMRNLSFQGLWMIKLVLWRGRLFWFWNHRQQWQQHHFYSCHCQKPIELQRFNSHLNFLTLSMILKGFCFKSPPPVWPCPSVISSPCVSI